MLSGVCDRSGTSKPVGSIKNQLVRKKLDYHNIQISDERYLGKVLKHLRQKLNLPESEKIHDKKTNVLIWELCMSTTMKAAVHLGNFFFENLVTYRNTNFEVLKTLFDIAQRLNL